MAINNRDRIGRALELLTEALTPYVDQHMSAAVPGKDWAELLAASDTHKPAGAVHSKEDLQLLLRCITERWKVFGALGRSETNFASEMREVRNRWAHMEQFNGDDTIRALDTCERLLIAVGAPDQAATVNKMRLDLQRTVYDDQARKRAKTSVGTVSTPGTGIKPWREVIEPHDDVAKGNFHAAEFAADLHVVAVGESTNDEYADPREFYARTYVTEGLRDLLQRASKRLSGDPNASPVVNLQTNFGGGKTHSMLALWHLFSGVKTADLPQAIQDAVGDVEVGDVEVRRVALVGTALGANQPRIKDDGTEVRTLWGELAWQLGGRAAYDVIADSDRTSTPPGDALSNLIADYSPALIMIDEWVAYARNLNDDDSLCGGRFEAQFTFAQQLTEAVSAAPGTMLVISIPASDGLNAADPGSQLEVGGARGRLALEALQNVVGRKADHWRPANSLESFEIVKRRLFKEPSAEAKRDIGAVAKQFGSFYRENSGTFPREATEMSYEERIQAAYPIHPELFDRLYNDWSTLERFQRTRGVLRLMSGVIHELWKANDASPLITPGSVPLHTASVAGELTNYLSDRWKPIIDQDIDGEGSTPVAIDAERSAFGQRSLTRRIARTVFMGSAPTLTTEHKGLEKPRIWLGVAIPGDTIGNFGSALDILGQRSAYLYADSGRFWFDTSPSIGRTAADIADKLREHPETVWEEIKTRLAALTKDRSDFAAIHPAPASSGDVPDVDSARLVVIHPRHQHTKGVAESDAMVFAKDVFQRHGSGTRTHGNMVVFAAFDSGRYQDDLEPAVRQYLAWKQINRRADEMDLRLSDKTRAGKQMATEDQTVTSRLRDALCWLLAPVQNPPSEPARIIDERVADTSKSIADAYATKLRTTDRLSSQYSSTRIRLALDGALSTVWSSGHVSVGDLWSLYTRYPYCDRLANRRVLEDAVLGVMNGLVFEHDGFALAERYDAEAGRYIGLTIPGSGNDPLHVTDSWLMVKPAVALAQVESIPETEVPAPGPGPGPGPMPGPGPVPTVPGPRPDVPALPALKTRYFASKQLDPTRYAKQFGDIVQEVLQRLTLEDGTVLDVTLEVTARNPSGFSESTIRTVRENSTVLKMDQHGFEEN